LNPDQSSFKTDVNFSNTLLQRDFESLNAPMEVFAKELTATGAGVMRKL
jgi:hypothetical protein